MRRSVLRVMEPVSAPCRWGHTSLKKHYGGGESLVKLWLIWPALELNYKRPAPLAMSLPLQQPTKKEQNNRNPCSG